MDSLPDISSENQLNQMVLCMQEDTNLLEAWTTLARCLHIPEVMIRRQRQNLLLTTYQFSDVLFNILHTWLAMNGGQAPLRGLCDALESLQLRNTAEKLQSLLPSESEVTDGLVTGPGTRFVSSPSGTKEFLLSNSLKVLVIRSLDPDVTMARLFDTVNPNLVEETNLHVEPETTGILKVERDLHVTIKSLLHSTKKYILVCPEGMALGEDAEVDEVQVIEDLLTWNDLTMEYQEELRCKLEKCFRNSKFQFELPPKTPTVLFKWIKGTGKNLFLELLHAYSTEMLIGCEGMDEVLYEIAALGLVSQHINASVRDKSKIFAGKEKKLLTLEKRGLLQKTFTANCERTFKFVNTAVRFYFLTKALVQINMAYRNFDVSAYFKYNEHISYIHEYLMTSLDSIPTKVDRLYIPSEIIPIALFASDLETAMFLSRHYSKYRNIHDIEFLKDGNVRSLLHLVVAFRDSRVLDMVKFLLFELGYREKLLSEPIYRDVIQFCITGTKHEPDSLVQDRIQTVECILELDNSLLNDMTTNKFPPLHVSNVNLKIIKFLVEKGGIVHPDVKSVIFPVCSFLEPAEVDDFVHYLVNTGRADHLRYFSKLNDEEPIHRVVCNVDVLQSTLQMFLDAGVDINAWDKPGGLTVLGYAVLGGRKRKCLKMLVDFGADWTVMCLGRKNSMLHIAARFGNIEAVEYFVELGIDINKRSGDEKTPLHSVFDGNRFDSMHDVVKTLIRLGADLSAKDENGLTPYQCALALIEKVTPQTLIILKPGNS